MQNNEPGGSGSRPPYIHELYSTTGNHLLSQTSGTLEGINDTPDELPRESLNINDLPDEVLLHIFSYIPVLDLPFTIQHVCTRWSDLSMCDSLWKDSLLKPSWNLSDQCLLSVLKEVPKLRRFDMESITPEILNRVAECCKDLRVLKFDFLHPNEGGEVFRNLVSQCTKVEHLSIPGRTLFNEEVFEHVGKWTNLRGLYLTGRFPKPVSLKPIAVGCPSLLFFYMGEANWSHSEVKYFLEMKRYRLQGLGIMPTSVEKSCAISLIAEHSKRLRELRLEGCNDGYNPNTFGEIKRITSLKSLTLMFTYGLTSDIMANVFMDKGMSQLLKLEILNSNEVNDDLVNVICMNCPRLLRLALQSSYKLKDDGLKYLYMCKNLQQLDLRECSSLTDAAMLHVSRCSKLKYLNIAECELTNQGLVQLLHLSELAHLDIFCCDVSGLPMCLFPQYLKKLRRLKFGPRGGIDEVALATLHKKMPHLIIERL